MVITQSAVLDWIMDLKLKYYMSLSTDIIASSPQGRRIVEAAQAKLSDHHRDLQSRSTIDIKAKRSYVELDESSPGPPPDMCAAKKPRRAGEN